MTDTAKPSATLPALQSTRLMAAQSDYRTWSCTIPYGVKPEAIMDRSYWRHHIRTVRPKDVVRCFAEDGTWERWLTVIKPDASGVVVSTLFHARHEAAAEEADGDFEIKWVSPTVQFAIVNKRTGQRVKENLYPQAVANAALAQIQSRVA